MFAKRESALWSLLRDNLKKEFLLTRIESVATAGVPDVYVVDKATGTATWVELKIVRGRKLNIGPEQVAWILRHTNCGLNVKIVARKDNTIFLWPGSLVVELVDKGIDVEGKKWSRPFDWTAISRTIREAS